MTASVNIRWDKENNPNAFAWCWVASQFTLLLFALLARTHIFHSLALMQRVNPRWEKYLGLSVYLLLLVTVRLYLNLLMNGLWHRNPDLHSEEAKTNSPELFEQSLLKSPDPIVIRDEIQWKRMLLSSVAMSILAATMYALY